MPQVKMQMYKKAEYGSWTPPKYMQFPANATKAQIWDDSKGKHQTKWLFDGREAPEQSFYQHDIPYINRPATIQFNRNDIRGNRGFRILPYWWQE